MYIFLINYGSNYDLETHKLVFVEVYKIYLILLNDYCHVVYEFF